MCEAAFLVTLLTAALLPEIRGIRLSTDDKLNATDLFDFQTTLADQIVNT